MKKVCPAGDCSGGTDDRQSDMSNDMFGQLSEAHKEGRRPKRCSYCGCVYDSVTKEIFGFYDNYNLGEGWKPRRSL